MKNNIEGKEEMKNNIEEKKKRRKERRIYKLTN